MNGISGSSTALVPSALVISNNTITATSLVPVKVGVIPWINAKYKYFTNMSLSFETVHTDRNLVISLEDDTNAVVLGTTTVSVSGFTDLGLTKPITDARMVLYVSYLATGADTTFPDVEGVVINLY